MDFPGSYRELWRLGSDRNSLRGLNLVLVLTQGLRPGLSYAALRGWIWAAVGFGAPDVDGSPVLPSFARTAGGLCPRCDA